MQRVPKQSRSRLQHGMDEVQKLIEQAFAKASVQDRQAVELAHKALALAAARGRTQGLQRPLAILADKYVVDRDIPQANHYLNQAEVQAISEGDWRIQAWVHRLRNIMAHELLDWQKSLYHLRRSIELFHENGEYDAIGYRALGRHYYDTGMYPEALETLYEVLDLTSTDGYVINKAATWGTIAIVYLALEDHERSIHANNKSYELVKSLNNRVSQALYLERRACLLRDGNFSDENLRDFEQACKIYEEENETQYYIHALHNYSHALYYYGRRADGLKIHQKATDLSKKFKRQKMILVAYYNRAIFYIHDKQYKEAIAPLLMAVKLAKEGNLQPLEASAHQQLINCYSQLGAAEQELHHTKIYHDLRQNLLGIQVQRKIATIQNRYEMQQARINQKILRMQNDSLNSKIGELNQEVAKMANILAQRNAALSAIKRQVETSSQQHAGSRNSSPEDLSQKIDHSLNSEPSWNDFEQLFASIHGNFIQTLSHDYPDLTPTELKVCTLLKLSMASKNIAETLILSPHTVNTHRQKIRRKLQLEKGCNLVTFLQQIEA